MEEYFFLKKKILFYFIFRQRGREREIKGEKHRCAREALISCLLHSSNWGPGLRPWHVP